jgi:hypothetical protein
MVRVPGDTDDPDNIMDDPPVWRFSTVILHGAIVGPELSLRSAGPGAARTGQGGL